MWRFVVPVLFALSFSSSLTAQESTLRYNIYGSGNWVPYVFADNIDPAYPGIVAEVIELVLRNTQISGESIRLPPERTNNSVRFGDYIDMDVVSPAWFKDGQPPFGELTTAFMTIEEYIVTSPINLTRFPSIEAIYQEDVVVGGVRGYYYYDSDLFNRMDFPSEEHLVKALNAQRVDVIIMGKPTADYFAQKLGVDVSMGPLHAEGELCFRISSSKSYLIPELNRAIERLVASGKIDTIIEKYRYLPTNAF
ncbi:MAG: transporter substrate-binding domain-containing protein [Alteromonadaceae bacterium]|nr:transporter substrate-binding domain-containing protein [Alteromonadaceae bacterium]